MPLTIFSRAQRGIPKLAIRAITGTAKNLGETSVADLAEQILSTLMRTKPDDERRCEAK